MKLEPTTILQRSAAAASAFRDALAVAAPRWNDLVFLEDPGAPLLGQRSAWSARDIAEHALSIDRINVEFVRRTLVEHEPLNLSKEMRALGDFDWSNRSYSWLSLDTAAVAVAELAERAAARDELTRDLSPDQLAFPVEINPLALAYMEDRGAPVEPTVAGLLLFCAEHMLDHAEQLVATLG